MSETTTRTGQLTASAPAAKATSKPPAQEVATAQPVAKKLTGDAYRRAFETLHVGIGIPGSPKEQIFRKFEALCDKANTTPNTAVWGAIEEAVRTGKLPDLAQITVSVRGGGGASSGFWLLAELDQQGRAVHYRVVEVEERSQYKGDTTVQFFRYNPEEESERKRAMRSAKREALKRSRQAGLPRPATFKGLTDREATEIQPEN